MFEEQEEKGQEHKPVKQEKGQVGDEGPPNFENMFPVYSLLKISEYQGGSKYEEPEYDGDRRPQVLQVIEFIFSQIPAHKRQG